MYAVNRSPGWNLSNVGAIFMFLFFIGGVFGMIAGAIIGTWPPVYGGAGMLGFSFLLAFILYMFNRANRISDDQFAKYFLGIKMKEMKRILDSKSSANDIKPILSTLAKIADKGFLTKEELIEDDIYFTLSKRTIFNRNLITINSNNKYKIKNINDFSSIRKDTKEILNSLLK